MGAYEAFARVYDLFMENADYAAWLEHLSAIWEGYGLQPKTVIDLGCGTGSIALPLARRGLDVIGVDLSPEMLSEAEHKARAEGLSLRLVCQDMTELALGTAADAIVSLCDSMNYLTEDGELEAAMCGAAVHLCEGGLFVFDLNTAYKFREVLGQNVFAATEEDAAYIWENDYDEEERINTYAVSFFIRRGDGLYERSEEVHYERAYEPEEIDAALRAAGLALLAVYDADTFAEPHPASERLLYVTRKAGTEDTHE